MHRSALREPQIPLDVKTHVQRNMFQCNFVRYVLVPPEPEK
jgi:hypothetical protein